ncbi:MAG: 50S ribosomal protein L3 [bacterium]
MKALIGKKVGMTHIFDEKGNVVPVTVVQAGPCTVVQVKTVEIDGYSAVQLGFGLNKRINKPLAGHVKDSGAVPRTLREFEMTEDIASENEETPSAIKVGDTFDVSVFSEGDQLQVTGTSKGKGFAGTIKRHNFTTGPKTHGSHNYRQPGSIGSGYPQHVMKGKKMAGQMGAEQVSVKNLKIVKIDLANNTVAIKGAVPGPRKGLVILRG